MLLSNLWENLQQNGFKIVCFTLDFQFFCTIMQLFDSDWPANILAALNFRAQENRLMSLDGVCAISVSLAGHETTNAVLSSS